MWSEIKVKTKVKKHSLIMCQCNQCGKKKWSQRRKKTSKVMYLSILNLCIWTVAFDGISNWYDSRGSWVFENVSAAVFEETAIAGEAQPEPIEAALSGTAANTSVSVAEAVGGNPVSSVSGSAIEAKIREVFHEAPEEAIKIASCESRFNPEQIGDEHLTFTHNGQVYGKSIGLFQVRTGGKERNGKVWTRSNDVNAFEQAMKDPEQNIDLAKKIWSGKKDWSPWYNCAKLVGIM